MLNIIENNAVYKQLSELDMDMDNIIEFILNLEVLKWKYEKLSLTKAEVAEEIGIKEGTLNNKISSGADLPEYIKHGSSKSAPVTFPIVAVAKYLTKTIKTNY